MVNKDNLDLPKVSVIIVNFNGLNYLRQTIPSVINLEYKNFEIIVVDNGSTDGSLEFLMTEGRVKVIRSPRYREKNFACNYAVKEASGEFLLMMDNDLVLQDKQILTKLIKRYKLNPLSGAIGFALVNIGESTLNVYGMYLGLFFDKRLKRVDSHAVKSFDGCEISYPPGPLIFIEKSKWDLVGGYDENLTFGGDDNDLGIKMWLSGYKNYLYSETIQLHIGMFERTNLKKWSFKFRNMVCAHFYTISKNYKSINVFIYLPAYFFFSFLKSIKQSLVRFSLIPLISWFLGVLDFIKLLNLLFVERKKVQKQRRIKKDNFLKIQVPKYKYVK